ncbi:glycoside hydrolase family 2 TIM barrel-domain containing protein [Escherichia coli]
MKQRNFNAVRCSHYPERPSAIGTRCYDDAMW